VEVEDTESFGSNSQSEDGSMTEPANQWNTTQNQASREILSQGTIDKSTSTTPAESSLDSLPANFDTFTQLVAKFGPDAETTRIMAESESHAEDNKLRGYELSLEQRDKQNQRDHEFRMMQLKHVSAERYVVLGLSSLALVAGTWITINGNPAVGNPIMSAALTVLITLISGKWKQNS